MILLNWIRKEGATIPSYDYLCKNCGHEEVIFHSMSKDDAQKCPTCGHEMIKLIGKGGGVIFKGPGFYATDYRDKK